MPLSTIYHLYRNGQFYCLGNRSTEERQRPIACHWRYLSHYVASSTVHLERDSNSQL